MKNSHIVEILAVILLLAGGLNWGLYGLFKLNLITAIFGEIISRIIFVLVGIAAGYRIFVWARSKSAVK